MGLFGYASRAAAAAANSQTLLRTRSSGSPLSNTVDPKQTTVSSDIDESSPTRKRKNSQLDLNKEQENDENAGQELDVEFDVSRTNLNKRRRSYSESSGSHDDSMMKAVPKGEVKLSDQPNYQLYHKQPSRPHGLRPIETIEIDSERYFYIPKGIMHCIADLNVGKKNAPVKWCPFNSVFVNTGTAVKHMKEKHFQMYLNAGLNFGEQTGGQTKQEQVAELEEWYGKVNAKTIAVNKKNRLERAKLEWELNHEDEDDSQYPSKKDPARVVIPDVPMAPFFDRGVWVEEQTAAKVAKDELVKNKKKAKEAAAAAKATTKKKIAGAKKSKKSKEFVDPLDDQGDPLSELPEVPVTKSGTCRVTTARKLVKFKGIRCANCTPTRRTCPDFTHDDTNCQLQKKFNPVSVGKCVQATQEANAKKTANPAAKDNEEEEVE